MNQSELELELQRIGVQKGDTLFLRISYKSLGGVEGGPSTVIKALRNCIGSEGNLVATAFGRKGMSQVALMRFFKKKRIYDRNEPYNIATGIIPNLLFREPDAVLSDHPVFPFVVVGPDAARIADEHTVESSPYGLLMDIMQNYGAKTLRIGGYILTGTTHFSFTEAMKQSNSYQNIPRCYLYYKDKNGKLKLGRWRQAAFCFDAYQHFFHQYIGGDAILYDGVFFSTEATLLNMEETLKQERIALNGHPERLLCDSLDCEYCFHTFSYSIHKMDYLFLRLRRLIGGPYRFQALKDLYMYAKSITVCRQKVQ